MTEAVLAREDVVELQLRSLHVGMTEMKGQLEKLTDAVAKLDVIEERQAMVAAALERAFGALKDQGDRIRVLEKSNAEAQVQNTGLTKWVDRALVGMAGFGAAFVLKLTGNSI